MNNFQQLDSWFVSFIIGFLYYLFLNYFILFFNSRNLFIRIVLDSFYIFIVSIGIIYFYFKYNNGYIHYGYPLFYILGYYVSKKVNYRVKALKKTFFLKK